MIPTDTLSIYAYAPSEYEAAQLNERIKQAMQAMAGQDAICNVAFYTDFPTMIPSIRSPGISLFTM